MSSLAKGAEIENEAKEHKFNNTCASDIESSSRILVNENWNRFKIYHKVRIVSKKGERFESDRANW